MNHRNAARYQRRVRRMNAHAHRTFIEEPLHCACDDGIDCGGRKVEFAGEYLCSDVGEDRLNRFFDRFAYARFEQPKFAQLVSRWFGLRCDNGHRRLVIR